MHVDHHPTDKMKPRIAALAVVTLVGLAAFGAWLSAPTHEKARSSALRKPTTTTIIPTTTTTTTTTTIPPTTTTTSPRVTPSLAVCTTSQLSISVVRGGVAMGHVVTAFYFLNGGSTCRMRGVPTLQMLTARGTNLSTTQTDGVTGYDAPQTRFPVETVALALGGRAYFIVSYHDGTGFTGVHCPASAALRITPPGQENSIVIPWLLEPYGGQNIQTAHCGDVAVSPVESVTVLFAGRTT
jgi:hypothetical protein